MSGLIVIASSDSYYCDDSVQGINCAGWKETNLDSTTKFMKNMGAWVETYPGGQIIAVGKTNATGFYSISWQHASCASNEWKVRFLFKGFDSSGSKVRFRLWKSNDSTFSTLTGVNRFGTGPCGATQCTRNKAFQRTSNDIDRAATVYYTAESALSEITTWSSNLDARFSDPADSTDGYGSARILFESAYQEGSESDGGEWMVKLDYSEYMMGMTLRHELGHLTHFALHHRYLVNSCSSYKLLSPTKSHSVRSCEFGYAAMMEGLAEFIGVRSIVTGSGNNAWACRCEDDTNQNVCSETAVGTLLPDKLQNCAGYGRAWKAIGDDFVTSTSHCTRLDANVGLGCACPDLPDPGGDGICDLPVGLPHTCPDADGDFACDNFVALGWRNETNVARFLWDLIDSSNESGQDDTSRTVAQLAYNFESMYCPSDYAFGIDGSCNEPNRLDPDDCSPSSEYFNFDAPPMTATRDSYNPFDIDQIVPGDQEQERTLNCVAGAED